MEKAERTVILKQCLRQIGFTNTRQLLEATYRIYWEEKEDEDHDHLVVWFEARPVAVNYSNDGFTLHFPDIQIFLDDPEISRATEFQLVFRLNRGKKKRNGMWLLAGILDLGREEESKFTLDGKADVEINP